MWSQSAINQYFYKNETNIEDSSSKTKNWYYNNVIIMEFSKKIKIYYTNELYYNTLIIYYRQATKSTLILDNS